MDQTTHSFWNLFDIFETSILASPSFLYFRQGCLAFLSTFSGYGNILLPTLTCRVPPQMNPQAVGQWSLGLAETSSVSFYPMQCVYPSAITRLRASLVSSFAFVVKPPTLYTRFWCAASSPNAFPRRLPVFPFVHLDRYLQPGTH